MLIQKIKYADWRILAFYLFIYRKISFVLKVVHIVWKVTKIQTPRQLPRGIQEIDNQWWYGENEDKTHLEEIDNMNITDGHLAVLRGHRERSSMSI